MALSYFYTDSILQQGENIVLDEETSKHITQVLRMKMGEALMLTNGKGSKANAIIRDDHRKRCEVSITSVIEEKEAEPLVAIAISLVKNSSRFEWFLEKATEIGVNEIIPVISARTEKEKFRYDRLKSILVSAMLQSQQCWLPLLHQPLEFNDLIKSDITRRYQKKFIAHCLDQQKENLTNPESSLSNKIILIGPEGDFTEEEIAVAIDEQYQPVALGATRLRTETAGIVAATLMRIT